MKNSGRCVPPVVNGAVGDEEELGGTDRRRIEGWEYVGVRLAGAIRWLALRGDRHYHHGNIAENRIFGVTGQSEEGPCIMESRIFE